MKVTGDSEEPEAVDPATSNVEMSGGDNEKTPSSSPSRIGNQLCSAHLCPTNKRARSTAAPKASRCYCKTCRCDEQERCRRCRRVLYAGRSFCDGQSGGEAIEKWYADLFKKVQFTYYAFTIDQDSPHV